MRVLACSPGKAVGRTPSKSLSKPGTNKLNPEPCKGQRRRPQLVMVGIVPYKPSFTRVLIVTQAATGDVVVGSVCGKR